MISMLRFLALAALMALLLGGCVVTPYVLDGVASELAADAEADDPRFRALCERYAGDVREFEPDRSQGIRLYGHIRRYEDEAGCSLACMDRLDEGWAFVEVHAYEQRARIYGRRQIEVYVSDRDHGLPDRLDEAQGYAAPVEAVVVGFGLLGPGPRGLEYRAEFTGDGERILHLRGARYGTTRGGFSGLRRIEDGAIHGRGRFSLFNRGTVMQGGVDGRVASCPS
jgi:hypothetical protein